MELSKNTGGDTFDYRQYDRIWQRVAPELTPYPEVRQTDSGAVPDAAMESLPGAQADPCCMGSAAQESLEVLTGFIEEELADCRHYLALARCAPNANEARILREIAADEGEHARRLMAVHYLITGHCYQPAIVCQQLQLLPWCQALRERYHAEACGGFNYIRAAEGTTDPCLSKLLTALSEAEYRHADTLLAMLSRALRQARSSRPCC